eukprot:8959455-Alexandrium_andersonii.AAC.1
MLAGGAHAGTFLEAHRAGPLAELGRRSFAFRMVRAWLVVGPGWRRRSGCWGGVRPGDARGASC